MVLVSAPVVNGYRPLRSVAVKFTSDEYEGPDAATASAAPEERVTVSNAFFYGKWRVDRATLDRAESEARSMRQVIADHVDGYARFRSTKPIAPVAVVPEPETRDGAIWRG